jgi:YVTN family beta-propeller protein
MKKIYLLLFIGIIGLLINGCDETDPIDPSIDTGFETTEVASIFKKNCASSDCHAGTSPPNGLSLESHAELLSGSKNRGGNLIPKYGGEAVIPFRSDKSLLYQIISGGLSDSSGIGHTLLSDDELLILKQWIDGGAIDNKGDVPFANLSSLVYVCNQNSDLVSVIDPASNVVTRILDVDLTKNFPDLPHMVKEHGNFYYVSLIGANSLLKVSKETNEIVAQVNGIEKAGMIQITPDGRIAYVSRSSTSPSIFSSVYAVDINSMKIISEIDLITEGIPHGMAISPDGLKLYVLNLSKNTIHVINTSTNESEELAVLSKNYEPMQAAISPDGEYLYLSARATGQLLVVETSSLTVVSEISLKPMPMQIAVSSDGTRIYVNSMMANVVQVIEFTGNSWNKTAEIGHPAFSMLHGIDISADDNFLYVSGRNTNGAFVPRYQIEEEGPPGIVGVIDTRSQEVIKVLEVDEFASGLVVAK